MMKIQDLLKSVLLFIVFIFLYYAIARTCFLLSAATGFFSIIWVQEGFALLWFILYGYRYWPALLISATLVAFSIGIPLLGALGIGAAITVEIVIALYVLKKFNFNPSLQRLRDIVCYLIVVVSTTLFAPTLGVFFLSFVDVELLGEAKAIWVVGPAHLIEIWQIWWGGNLLGDLIIPPLALVWLHKHFFSQNQSTVRAFVDKQNSVEFICLILSTALISWLLLDKLGGEVFLYLYVLIPPLLWSALRFKLRGVTVAGTIIIIIALIVMSDKEGALDHELVQSGLLPLQLFFTVKISAAMIIAGVILENEKASFALENVNKELDLVVKQRTESLENEILQHKKMELKLRSVTETAKEAIISINQKGMIIYFSKGAEKMFGFSVDETLDKPLTMLLCDKYHDEYLRGLDHFFSTGEEKLFGNLEKITAIRKNREEFPAELSLAHWEMDGEIFFTAIIRDVTERHLVEMELKRSNEELKSFAHVVSHDLQEPLRGITSYVQLLNKRYHSIFTQEAKEFIGFIMEGALKMKALITSLLEYATIGKEPLKGSVDAEAVLVQVQRYLEDLIQKKGAIITHDPLPIIIACEVQFLQLLQNIVSNAIKFCEDPVPRVHISAKEMEDEWLFMVKDNGIGIEHQYFDRIFTLSGKLHAAGKYPGTGIGLTICKKIVANHHGRIWVNSLLGKGTTFYFTIAKNRGNHE